MSLSKYISMSDTSLSPGRKKAKYTPTPFPGDSTTPASKTTINALTATLKGTSLKPAASRRFQLIIETPQKKQSDTYDHISLFEKRKEFNDKFDKIESNIQLVCELYHINSEELLNEISNFQYKDAQRLLGDNIQKACQTLNLPPDQEAAILDNYPEITKDLLNTLNTTSPLLLALENNISTQTIKLGEGNSGVVYKVSDNGTIYALKEELFSGNNHTKLKSFRLQQTCHSQHVINAIECGRIGKSFYTAYECGDTSMKDKRINDLSEQKKFLKQILSGLNDIHNAGVLHRDIKEANIVKVGDTYKITDFGLAITVGETVVSKSGTRTYLANSVIPNCQDDIYAFGITCLNLFLGCNLTSATDVPSVIDTLIKKSTKTDLETFLLLMINDQTESASDLLKHDFMNV